MARKTIYAIGVALPDVEGFEAFEIDSEVSLLDADIVMFRPSFDGLRYGVEEYAGQRLLTQGVSHTLGQMIGHWRRQLQEAFDAGKTVVILMAAREQLYRYTGTSALSGTGRSQQRTNHVTQVDSYQFIPVQLQNLVVGNGTAMKLASGAEAIASFWSAFADTAMYRAHFSVAGRPLVLTKSGEKVVGARVTGPGNWLLLPELQFDRPQFTEREGDHEIWSNEAERFTLQLRDALFALDANLRSDSDKTQQPDWASGDQYRLPQEAALESTIAELSTAIDDLFEQRELAKVALAKSSELRDLLFEKGKPLERAVNQALHILGFEAAGFESADSEFDSVFTSTEGRFLGEVEGKDRKPVNIDKYSQLERNLMEDFKREEVSERAKGVLFCNGYRLEPPSERKLQFTDKLIKDAALTGVALVATADLFEVARYLVENPNEEFAARCRGALVEGAGKIVIFPQP